MMCNFMCLLFFQTKKNSCSCSPVSVLLCAISPLCFVSFVCVACIARSYLTSFNHLNHKGLGEYMLYLLETVRKPLDGICYLRYFNHLSGRLDISLYMYGCFCFIINSKIALHALIIFTLDLYKPENI